MTRDDSKDLSSEFTDLSPEQAAIEYNIVADSMISTMHSLVADELLIQTRGKFTPKNLLDIGTGLGHMAVEISKRFIDVPVYGLDISIDTLTVAKRQGGLTDNIRLITGGVSNLPFPDNSIYIVVSFGSLHHWGDKPTAIKEIDRVLASGGIAFIMDLRGDADKDTVKRIIETMPESTGTAFLKSIEDSMTPTELEGLFERAGISDFRITIRPFSRKAIVMNAWAIRAASMRIDPGSILWAAIFTGGGKA